MDGSITKVCEQDEAYGFMNNNGFVPTLTWVSKLPMPTLPGHSLTGVSLNGLNNKGDVIGRVDEEGGNSGFHASFWPSHGKPIPFPADYQDIGIGHEGINLNDNQQIVCGSDGLSAATSPCVWDARSNEITPLQDFPAPIGGWNDMAPQMIDNRGNVFGVIRANNLVGISWTQLPAVWHKGQPKLLGPHY
ncbi:MAG: hypothetical protein IPP19_09410 [Verrucomicrobia bacterium]|nr:hypothetical protein [Verrucomicrobiota bacterium]